MSQMKNILYPELSYRIVGILYAAHNTLGRFCRERQYSNAIRETLRQEGIRFRWEFVVPDAGNRVDFLIEDIIVLELKAKPILSTSDYNQVKRYLQSLQVDLGILVNFRQLRIEPQRVLRPPSAIQEIKRSGNSTPQVSSKTPRIRSHS